MKDQEYVSHQAVDAQINSLLLGKVLTIIDASYSDIQQRQAVKDLVKQAFYNQVDWLLQRQNTFADSKTK